MKKLNDLIGLLFSLIMIMLFFAGCGGGGGGGSAAILVSISVTPANQSIIINDTQQFTATGTYSDSTQKDITTAVTWTSSDTGVAEISTTGIAIPADFGSTTITATSGSISGSTTLTVVGPPGSLDTTFGTDGIVTTPVGSGDDIANALGIQSDGKIVVAGTAYNGSDYDFAAVRYNSDGSRDSTFDTDGIVTTPIGSSDDSANALGIQSDGKIVIAGSTYNGSDYDFAVVRYNSNGTLDTTFGTGGIVTTPIGSSDDSAYALGIQSDGKIVVAGYTYNGSDYDFAVVRYNSDGSLDSTFDTDGIVTTLIGSTYDLPNALGIQSDGKIVVAGSTFNGSNDDFAVVRYYSNGTLDATFGTGGIVTTSIGSSDDIAHALGIQQSDGKIVIAGSTFNGSKYNFAVVRCNSNGTLDTTFGTGGIVTTSIGSSDDIAYALSIQSDGKIVAAGYTYNGSDYDFAIARYNLNGTLDTTFGTGGTVTTPIGSGDDMAYALGIQSDGKIVAAGSTYYGSINNFAVVRYWP
ncbi:MAG: Ig-like domain-containing protein [Deltaproteobacteria bacterium]|nr:Ig-like domain-containing protein [Deltaproteobacteria bacterium]